MLSSIRTLTLPARLGVLILGLVAVTAAILGTAQVTFAATSSSGSSVSDTYADASVFDGINQVRADAGVTALLRNSALDKVAADWAYQQWKNGAMSHNPNYSSQIPSGWTKAGENVASGYTYDKVVAAWKASSGHYANMVRDYTDIGIGYYEGPDGTRYWSTVFALYTADQGKTTVGGTHTADAYGTPAATSSSSQPSSAPAAPASSTPASYPAEPAAPAGTAIPVAAASFEGNSNGWSTSGGSVTASIYGPAADVRGGKYALSITPNGSGRSLVQDISTTVDAGAEYTATVWLRAGSSAAINGALQLTALGGTPETATMNFSGITNGWTKVSIALAPSKSGHTGLRLQVTLPASGVAYQVDSVSLVRTKNAPAAQPAASSSPAPAATPAKSSTPTPQPTATKTAQPAPAPAPTATSSAKPSSTPSATPTPTPSSSRSTSSNGITITIGH